LDLEVWEVRQKYQYYGGHEPSVEEQNVVQRRVNVFAMQAFKEI
jgi:hypothetical protein